MSLPDWIKVDGKWVVKQPPEEMYESEKGEQWLMHKSNRKIKDSCALTGFEVDMDKPWVRDLVFGLRLANLEIKLKKILKDYQDQRQWAETWEIRKSRPPEALTESDEVMEEQLMYVRDYTSYDDMVQSLGDLVNTYPAIIDRYNQGELERGRSLVLQW